MLEKNTIQNKEPQLAPPGAGIPWTQQKVLQYFVAPFVANRTDWDISERRFRRINEKILLELEGLSEQQLGTRILVPPQQGLEDSSRYWSIAMTLEHMVIAGKGIFYAISELSQDKIPAGEANTAAVKPSGGLSINQSVEQFKKFTDVGFQKLLESIKNRDSKLKFRHPWFGLMNAKQWFWLLPIHHNLHLKQIREIKKRLPVL